MNPVDPQNDIPYRFSIIGQYNTPCQINDMCFANNRLYLANGADGLVIIDVSDPKYPSRLGRYTLNNAVSVKVSGDRVWLIDKSQGNPVSIDVSDPNSPRLVREYDSMRVDALLASDGPNVYTSESGGMVVYDGSNVDTLIQTWQWNPPGGIHQLFSVYFAGDTLFALEGWSGVYAFTNAPASPRLVSRFFAQGTATGMIMSGHTAFVTLMESILVAIDFSNLSSPVMTGECFMPGIPFSIAFGDNIAFMAYTRWNSPGVVAESGVVAVDIRYPESMRLIAKYDKPANIISVCAQGNTVFLADKNKGITILQLEQ